MAEDKRAEPPEQPKTTQLPAVTERALLEDLRVVVTAGFTTIGQRLDSQDSKLERVVTSGIDTNVRLDRVETRLTQAEDRVTLLEGRAGKTSLAVKGASQVDLEQAAQLAQERAAREALASKVDSLTESQQTQLAILGRLDKVASNPLVKTLGAMLLTALVTWLASHGIQVHQ